MHLQPRTTDSPLLATDGVQIADSDSSLTKRTCYYRSCKELTPKDNENKEIVRLYLNVTDF